MKSASRTAESIAWLKSFAKDEMEDPEDQVWLFQLLHKAYAQGAADSRRATMYEMHAYVSAAEKARLVSAEHEVEEEAAWAALTPEQQEARRQAVRAQRKKERERLAEFNKQVAQGKEILKAEKVEGR